MKKIVMFYFIILVGAVCHGQYTGTSTNYDGYTVTGTSTNYGGYTTQHKFNIVPKKNTGGGGALSEMVRLAVQNKKNYKAPKPPSTKEVDKFFNMINAVNLKQFKKNKKINKIIWNWINRRYSDSIYERKISLYLHQLKAYHLYKQIPNSGRKKYLYLMYKPNFSKILFNLRFGL